jgi:hypothetical protein
LIEQRLGRAAAAVLFRLDIRAANQTYRGENRIAQGTGDAAYQF